MSSPGGEKISKNIELSYERVENENFKSVCEPAGLENANSVRSTKDWGKPEKNTATFSNRRSAGHVASVNVTCTKCDAFDGGDLSGRIASAQPFGRIRVVSAF